MLQRHLLVWISLGFWQRVPKERTCRLTTFHAVEVRPQLSTSMARGLTECVFCVSAAHSVIFTLQTKADVCRLGFKILI